MKDRKVALASLRFAPVGRVWIAACAEGVVRVHLGGGREEMLFLLAREGWRPGRGRWAEQARRQLQEYLAGRRGRFSLKLCPPPLTGFRRRVYRALAKVPYGQTVTYGRLAAQAGFPGAARAVGRAMAENPLPLLWPCHRVVGVAGLVGFGAGLRAKLALLELERKAAPGRRGRSAH